MSLNTAPLVSTPLADQSANEDAAFSFTLPATAFSDPNAGDSLSYSASLSDGNPLPSWLSFNASDRTFSGTPGNADVGTLDILVTATDTGNLSVSDVFTLTIGNTNDAPTVTGPVTLANGVEDQSYTLTAAQLLANASDADVGDTLRVQSVSVDPVDGNLTDNGDGSWTFTPNASRNGLVNFAVAITDGTATVSTSAGLTLAAANHRPTFTLGDGKLTTAIGTGTDLGRSISLQADGKILVAGSSDTFGNRDFALVRYNADGSLDTSFSSDGKLTTAIGAGEDSGRIVVLQPDGKILLAGRSTNGSNSDFVLVRYNVDGSLDTTFSGDGKLSTAIGGGLDNVDMALQADGKIIVVGSIVSPTYHDWVVLRYNPDGSLDNTFDSDGKVQTSLNAFHDRAFAVDVQPDGKILVGGFSATNPAVVRFNSDGSIDSTFGGGDGIFISALVSNFDVGVDMKLQADGKILLLGQNWNGNNYDLAVIRLNADGSLDTTFDSDGMAFVAIGTGNDTGWGITLQSDGKILVTGEAYSGTFNDFFLVRLNSDGTLDSSFNHDGRLITDFSGGYDYGQGVTVQSDGKIVVAGYSFNGSNADFALARYNADGSLDASFDLVNTLNGTPLFIEGGAAVVLDADVQVLDSDLTASTYAGATLTLTRHGGANGDDVFLSSGSLGPLSENGNLSVGGIVIGAVTANSAGRLLLTFNGNATQSLVNAALQQIAYRNSSDAPPALVQVDWTFSDGNSGAQGAGGALSVTGSATVSITGVNDAPTAANNTLTTNEDTGKVLAVADFAFSDAEGGSLGSVTITSLPTAGSLALNGTAVTLNQMVSAADINAGKLVFTPVANANGSGYASFGFKVSDGAALSVVAYTMVVDVTAANDAPTVSAPVNLADGTEDTAYTISTAQLLANASDVDVGATLNVQSVTVDPSAGSVTDNGNGTWSFNPAANRNGPVSFAVVITDGTATVATTASLNLAPVNDAPTGNVSLSGTALEGQTLTASHTLADADGLGVIGYQWQTSSNGTSWSDLAGATAATLALGAALIGLQIRVLASYTDGGNTLESVASSATAGIAQLLNPIDGTDGSDNPLLGTDGADLIRARAGNDVVQARAGDDTAFGEGGDDILYGEDGNDSLDGGSGYNQLLGGNGNDTLNIGTGASDSSYAFGGTGDDVLIANGLANTFAITLAGESGSDTYRVDGSGNVSLSDYVNTTTASELNRLELAAGITPANITVSGDGNSIILGFANGKTLHLSNQLLAFQASDNPNQYGIQELRFSDGTVWGRQQLREMAGYFIGNDTSDDTITTGAGNQILYGHAGNDSLSADAGDDQLFGGQGDDLLLGGDGNDVLIGDDGSDNLDGGSGYNQLIGGNGNDTLNLGTGASDSSYAFGGVGDDLLIANGLANTFAITLAGESGSDTYRFDGSGNVSLSDYVNTTTASDLNRLELAAGITPANVTVSGDGNSIVLGFATGKTLHLSNQLLAFQASDNPNQYGIQEVLFSDGTVWGRQQLREMAGYFIGNDASDDTINTGAGNQILYGHAGNDSLSAGAGDDQLYGGQGDDLLLGGDGNDVLIGDDGNDNLDGGSGYNQLIGGNGNDTLNIGIGASDSSYAFGGTGDDVLIANGLANTFAITLAGESGSDTYRFDGSGNVSLSDYVNTTTASDLNRLELAAGITPANITVSGDGNSIILGFATGKTLHLSNQLLAFQASDNPNQYGIQEVLFSDGTVWGRQQLRELAGYFIGNDASDDSISTGAGTQFLFGHGGNDGLAAGAGEDQLYGGFGDDFLQGGEGNDVLFGDDGNDTLDGGSGANQLIGGSGNDTFRFSAAPDATTSNVVSGFTQGADHLSLDSSAFQFNGQPIEAVLANVSATQTEQAGAQLVYSQSNQTLYYDADGAANGNSVAVVTLAGVATLAASDVLLFS
ncbi:cadherin-like domain-containing protein [Pseudomonas putida]|uniref:cadherin-like domain-containing protein n=1 Tax=Pseudomonas putida TaxID=303 RepID=UPI002E36D367|nr:cadherin-like domain-containing protein [Pseudomonas putida]